MSSSGPGVLITHKDDPPLWRRSRGSVANRAAGFSNHIDELSPVDLAAEFGIDLNGAPRRGSRGKNYFGAQRNGFPQSDGGSNRREEHLMIALFCAGSLLRPDGSHVQVIDYQTPLKAKQSDRIGKLDGLALLPDGGLCLMELKAPKDGRGDSPLRALLECLAYAAVVQANRGQFVSELKALARPGSRYVGFVDLPSTLLVMGPRSWWTAWEECTAAGDWKPPLKSLSEGIANDLGLQIAYGALEGFEISELRLGTRDHSPTIPPPLLVNVEGLPPLST
jgi:hypothetical protein